MKRFSLSLTHPNIRFLVADSAEATTPQGLAPVNVPPAGSYVSTQAQRSAHAGTYVTTDALTTGPVGSYVTSSAPRSGPVGSYVSSES
ncbi:hypothetical protein GCM10025779_22060 [Arthrobacter cryoconiti]